MAPAELEREVAIPAYRLSRAPRRCAGWAGDRRLGARDERKSDRGFQPSFARRVVLTCELIQAASAGTTLSITATRYGLATPIAMQSSSGRYLTTASPDKARRRSAGLAFCSDTALRRMAGSLSRSSPCPIAAISGSPGAWHPGGASQIRIAAERELTGASTN